MIKTNLLDWFFPKRCGICGEIIGTNSISPYFCNNCMEKIQIDLETKNFYNTFINEEFSFDNIISASEYKNYGKNLMLNMKIGKNKNIAKFYADTLSKQFNEKYDINEFSHIIYVPSSRKSYQKRGFNQSKWIAKEISKKLNIPLCNNAFIRKNSSKSQHTLDVIGRKKNADSSYILKKNIFKGKNIILVDDIFTTGATLNALSKCLKTNGTNKIICLVGAVSIHRQ